MLKEDCPTSRLGEITDASDHSQESCHSSEHEGGKEDCGYPDERSDEGEEAPDLPIITTVNCDCVCWGSIRLMVLHACSVRTSVHD